MNSRSLLVALGLGLVVVAPNLDTDEAIGKRMIRHRPRVMPAAGDVHFRTDFAVLASNPTIKRLPDTSSRGTTGSSVAALGQGAVAIDAETGTLSLLDKNSKVKDTLKVGDVAGLLTVDPVGRRIFVADRNGDRIVVVAYGDKLRKLATIKTRTEPFGVALTPDGNTLLVTTVAGRRLQAFDTAKSEQRWEMEIGPEARAVTVSPDGNEAVVSFLGTGAIARVKLQKKPTLRFETLAAPPMPTEAGPAVGRNNAVPERFARNAFAATFVGDTAVVAYQQSTPLQAASSQRESRGTYGGSAEGNPPLLHRLAFMPRGWNSPGRAHVRVQMPRALAYDAKNDSLVIADLANDEVVVLANSSDADIRQESRRVLQRDGKRCGPDGVAVAANGDLLVHCSFDKRVARLPGKVTFNSTTPSKPIAWSPALSKSPLSKSAQRGRALFHKGNDSRLSMSGAMSCANCHPEARSDGLSWRIEGTQLQTPLLAGRMLGTHPFKWDGQDKDLMTSLMKTTVRLGGGGIQTSDAADLRAYLESLPSIRVNEDVSLATLASQKRGKRIFNDKEVGCSTCHSGKNYSDGKTYEFSDDIKHVNTPSLLGLAASAPYYHDGSAASLRDLVLENGSVHGMGRLDSLEPQQVDDLVAFLETL
jgi:DNA-binding beta-propeller fold protein YncE/mono/diheme cytochrome c family protein